MKSFTGLLNKNNIPLLAGSDTFGHVVPGFSIHRELELLVEAGLTPFEALKTATVNAAYYLGKQDLEGTVALGKSANLVLLESNPLDDIHSTRDISGVVLDGTFIGPKDLSIYLEEVLKF